MFGKFFSRVNRAVAPRLFQPRNVQRVICARSLSDAPVAQAAEVEPEVVEFVVPEIEFAPELEEVTSCWAPPRIMPPYKIIEPLFQVYEFPVDPSLYEIDCSNIDMHFPNADLEQKMRDTMRDVGAIHLKNTGLTEHQSMRRWASVILDGNTRYSAGANPRKPIEPNVYDVGAPAAACLQYHHEMAYVGKSPKFISLWCKYGLSGNRGWTYISDNLQATDALLATPFGEKLRDLDICYVRNLTDKSFYDERDQSMIYNHWQDSFETENLEDVQAIAEERDLKVEWEIDGNNRFLKTKYYISAFEYFASLDRNVLYSSVADDFMWFDTWPGVDVVPINERPLALTFGDDSFMNQEEKQEFVDIYDAAGFPIKWKPGEIAILCNYRWAHGRPSYQLQEGEKRELGLLLGQTFDRIGHLDGKW